MIAVMFQGMWELYFTLDLKTHVNQPEGFLEQDSTQTSLSSSFLQAGRYQELSLSYMSGLQSSFLEIKPGEYVVCMAF